MGKKKIKEEEGEKEGRRRGRGGVEKIADAHKTISFLITATRTFAVGLQNFHPIKRKVSLYSNLLGTYVLAFFFLFLTETPTHPFPRKVAE